MQTRRSQEQEYNPAIHSHLSGWPRKTSYKAGDGARLLSPPPIDASQVEKHLWPLGDDSDRYHRAKVFRPLPQSIAAALGNDYKDIFKKGRTRANLHITKVYNRQLKQKLNQLSTNPLIFKPQDIMLDVEYLFSPSREYPELPQHGMDPAEKYILDLLSYKQKPELLLCPKDTYQKPELNFHQPTQKKSVHLENDLPETDLDRSAQRLAEPKNLKAFFSRSDLDLRDLAFDLARKVYKYYQLIGQVAVKHFSDEQATKRVYYALCAIPNQMGIRDKYQNTPFENLTWEHAEIGTKRLICERWWLRHLRKIHRQAIEGMAVAAALVHNKRQVYVSNDTFLYYEKRQQENEAVLNAMVAFNEDKETEVPLSELIEKSVSNPVIRRHELMVRMRGAEEYAIEQEHVGLFITLTAPSKYHATSSAQYYGKKSAFPNPKYCGVTPKETNQYLVYVFQKIRTALQKLDIQWYGTRVVEPHEDSTPHHHYLLFCDKDKAKTIVDLFKKYGLEVDGREKGARKNRVVIKYMDPGKGGATAYIAKYIAKNVDGYQADGKELDGDNLGNKASVAAKRITAWRKCWNIRAFQFSGLPSIGVYRELRKWNSDEYEQEESAEAKRQKPVKKCDDPIIEKARFYADQAFFAQFIDAMGGVCIPRKLRPIQLLKPQEPVINRYGEAVPHKAIGVQSFTGSIITSGETWSIHHKSERPAQKAKLRRESEESKATRESACPWSTVNNNILWPAEASNADIRDAFQYPSPPNTKVAEDELSKISSDDQILAEHLLSIGFHQFGLGGKYGPIARLKRGETIHKNKESGYRLTTWGDGSQSLVEIKFKNPEDDFWWDEFCDNEWDDDFETEFLQQQKQHKTSPENDHENKMPAL